MDPVTMSLIATGAGGALKVFGDLFNDTGAKEADITRKSADLKLGALEENMRRTEGQQTQVLSSTKARMAGSGFSTESQSYDNYLTSMATEFQAQNKFTRQQGMASIELMREGADIQGDPMAKWLGAAGDLFGTASKIGGLLKGI